MTQATTPPQSTPDRFSLALLCLVVAAMPTQYGQTVKHLTSSGGTAFERTISVGDAMLGLAFALWGLRVLLRWRWRECRWPSVACVGLVVVAALSAMHSELIAGEIAHAGSALKAVRSSLMIRTSLKEWVQFVIYALLAYTLFVNLLKETRFFRGSLYILFGVATVAVGLGLKDYFVVADPKLVRAGMGESAYLFNSQNIYSGFLAMVFPLMLAVVVSTRNMAVRVWLGACVVLGAVTMLGAGGLLATFLVLPTCAFRHDRKTGWLVAAAMAGLLVLLIAPRTRSYRDGIRPLFTVRDDEGDVSKQYVEWQAGLGMLEDHPLFGVGTGLYQLNIGAYYGALPNKEKMPWDSNSLYLVVASTMGLVGLAALLCFIVQPLLVANGLIGSLVGDDRNLVIGLWGSMLAFAITSGLNCLWVRGTAPVLVYLIAMIAVLNQAEAAERSR
jgi:O-antigen ligase